MINRINRNYFPEQHWPVGLYTAAILFCEVAPELLYIAQTRFRPFSRISCKQMRFHLFKPPIFNNE